MLEKTYSPHEVENRLYPFWEDNLLFRPEINAPAEEKFCIVIPPPNVTGTLHMGHALDNTLQDILVRWHRMQGHETLWMPGTDHAGIATQNVVERNLRVQNLTKYDLGREKFLEEVWTWANARKKDILNQFRRLGISPDWSRQRFTLDDGLSKAVREAFVRLYEDGLIYRGARIVNWCPRCTSAISDIETEYVDEESFLWEISYPLKDGAGALVVATTRPETMFGDVAVAVNPQDSRYKDLIGKTVILPLANAELPIITDNHVAMDFGTGALKITPAHDPNDFEIALRHHLEPIWVIDESGNLKVDPRVPEALQGMERFEARQKTEALLEQHGFLIQKQPHVHSVGHCQRCGTTIEPLLSKQWFVKCKPLAEKSIASLEHSEIQFIPERWTKIYLDWMENIRDWCISRQLWWGHQIPAWYCNGCDEVIVARETPTQCTKCQSSDLRQETDVLDTWFSSGLWPFSTLGWPDTQAEDFKKFYPTDVLVTGFDIIFFWVARMVMFGLKLTDQSPFHTVYIHGLIRDEKGQKMSKSKGNTINPVEIIDDYGCDALRYSLTSLVTYGGQDIKLSKDSFEKGKLFANKLWNASRFVLMNLEGVDDQPIDQEQLTSMDCWILSALEHIVYQSNLSLKTYRYGELADSLYLFIWDFFCDWYVEYAKKQLREDAQKANTQRILLFVLDSILRLLHPIMPYITEEIWQKLPHRKEKSIMISAYPQAPDYNEDVYLQNTRTVQDVIETIRTLRNVRQSSGVSHQHKTPAIIECADSCQREALESNQDIFYHFVKLESLTFTDKVETLPPNTVVGVVGTNRVIVSLAGAIDVEAEVSRQKKKLETLQKEFQQVSGLLANPGFLDRAPEAVVEKNKSRLEELTQQIKAIEDQLVHLVH